MTKEKMMERNHVSGAVLYPRRELNILLYPSSKSKNIYIIYYDVGIPVCVPYQKGLSLIDVRVDSPPHTIR